MFVRPAPALGNTRHNVLIVPAVGKHQCIYMITIAAGRQPAN